VVERLAPAFGGLDEDLQIGAGRRLADELVERLRPQRLVHVLAALFWRDQSGGLVHRALLACTSRGDKPDFTAPVPSAPA
jgi:hypothetical protein